MKHSKIIFLSIISLLVILAPQFPDAFGAEVNNYSESITTCGSTSTDNTSILEVTDSSDFDFISGEDYLIVVSGMVGGSSNADNIGLEVSVGGSLDATSLMNIEPSGTINSACGNDMGMYTYMWFDVFNSDGTDTIVVQSVVGGGDELFYDNVNVFVLHLSGDLTTSDWGFDEGGTQTLGTSWDTIDNALTVLNTSTNNDILVLGMAQLETGSTNKVYETRLEHSYGGCCVDTFPAISMEGEDTTNDSLIQSFMFVLTENSPSNTYQIASQRESGGGGTHERISSKIFVMNLEVFDAHAFSFDSDGEGDLGTTEYGTTLETVEYTPASATIPSVIMGYTITQSSELAEAIEVRLQADNDADSLTDFPAGQTTNSHDYNHPWDVGKDNLSAFLIETSDRDTDAHTVILTASEESAITSSTTVDVVVAIQLSITSGTPAWNIDNVQVFESGSTTMGSGVLVCDIDVDSANTCSGMKPSTEYRIETEVDNTGDAGSPTSFEIRDGVSVGGAFGSITSTEVTSAGCDEPTGGSSTADQTNWSDSVATEDIILTSGTTCEIPATTGSAEFYVIFTTDPDLDEDTNVTFFVSDGTVTDTSASIKFIPVLIGADTFTGSEFVEGHTLVANYIQSGADTFTGSEMIEGHTIIAHYGITGGDVADFTEGTTFLTRYIANGGDVAVFVETHQAVISSIFRTDTAVFSETDSTFAHYVLSGGDVAVFVEGHSILKIHAPIEEGDVAVFVEGSTFLANYITIDGDVADFTEGHTLEFMAIIIDGDIASFVEGHNLVFHHIPLVDGDTAVFVEGDILRADYIITGGDVAVFVEGHTLPNVSLVDGDTAVFVEQETLRADYIITGGDVAVFVEGHGLSSEPIEEGDVASYVEGHTLTANYVITGGDVAVFVEGSTLIGPPIEEGDVAVFVEPETITAHYILTGGDVAVFVEGHSLSAQELTEGDVAVFVEGSTFLANYVTIDGDVAVFVEQETLRADYIITGGDVAVFVEGHTLSAEEIVEGDVASYVEGHTLTANYVITGGDVAVFVEGSTLIGPPIEEGDVASYVEGHTLTANYVITGGDVAVFVEGHTLSAEEITGGDVAVFVEQETLRADYIITGGDVAVFVEDHNLAFMGSITGGDVAVFVEGHSLGGMFTITGGDVAVFVEGHTLSAMFEIIGGDIAPFVEGHNIGAVMGGDGPLVYGDVAVFVEGHTLSDEPSTGGGASTPIFVPEDDPFPQLPDFEIPDPEFGIDSLSLLDPNIETLEFGEVKEVSFLIEWEGDEPLTVDNVFAQESNGLEILFPDRIQFEPDEDGVTISEIPYFIRAPVEECIDKQTEQCVYNFALYDIPLEVQGVIDGRPTKFDTKVDVIVTNPLEFENREIVFGLIGLAVIIIILVATKRRRGSKRKGTINKERSTDVRNVQKRERPKIIQRTQRSRIISSKQKALKRPKNLRDL